jgi:asparagine synthase (glutamine-hydrolysing)
MNFLAGLYYFDGRPIPEGEAAAIRRGSGRSISDSGVLLCDSNESRPIFHQGVAVIFDGRLDNREDLLIRFGDRSLTVAAPKGAAEPSAPACDAMLALTAYQKSGAAGLVHLIGDWSLIIWDEARKALVLASDFAGVRPLYYCVQQERAICATSLQALLEWVETDSLDDAYVAGMLASGGCPHTTPYRGVYSVPPGHSVTITKDGVNTQAFWRPPVSDTIRYQHATDYEEHLRGLFRDAVRCRLRTDAPVLSELSGGLDSSSIVCMAKHLRESGEPQNSRLVTLSHEHQGSRDARFYTAVEEFCGFENIHVPTDEHPFLTESDTGIAIPAFWDRLHSHNASIARRLGARTYLTGQLGDLVMGNWWDDSVQVAGLLRYGRIGPALKQSLSWSKALRRPIWGILGRAMLANLPRRLTPDRAYGNDASIAPRNLEDSWTDAFRKRVTTMPASSSRIWMEAAPERRMRLRQLMEALESRKLQAPEPLQHLSYTHPYAHRPLVTFMLSIPPNVVCGPGQPRRLMRAAFEGLWPPDLRRRQSKDSFSSVFLDSLRPLAQILLSRGPRLELVERGFLDLASLRKRLERLSHSLDCNATQLRQIILLELWLEGRANRLKTATPISA